MTHYPHTHHKNHLMSATAKLKVEVSELHAGQNGHLEISCRATIPAFPTHHEQFADIKTKVVSGKFFFSSHRDTPSPLFRVARPIDLRTDRSHSHEFSKTETGVIPRKYRSGIILLRDLSLSGNRNARFRVAGDCSPRAS